LKLSELKKGERAIVKKIDGSKEIRQRFASFGLLKDAELELIDYTMTKSNLEIMVGNTLLALRKEEADNIEVEVI